jgi:hypothetical protein
MTTRGQLAVVGKGEAASALNVKGSIDPKTLTPYDPLPYTPAVVAKFRERWSNLFKPK